MAEPATFRRCRAYSDCAVDQAAVILDSERHLYFAVNRVGARIWRLLEQPRTVDGLVALLLAEFAVTPNQCRAEIEAFLGQLTARGLAERCG